MKLISFIAVLVGFITICFGNKSIDYTNGIILVIGGCIIFQLDGIINKLK